MSEFPPALPPGTAKKLAVILQCMEADPDFLELCPYPADDVEVLRQFTGAAAAGEDFVEEDIPEETNKWGRLERESNKLFKMLTDFSSKLDSKDNAETMAYFRTATSLLDKIVGIQERAANLKQINLFHETVLTVMEDVLDAGQRTEVMSRLKASIKPES